MFDRLFHLTANRTTAGREMAAGATTFLTMAYIVFVQPAILSGEITGQPTGMDEGAITTATCLAAALATVLMGLYARYPIALAPGMGQNVFFVSVVAAAGAAGFAGQAAWQVALGAVFVAGVLFLLVTLTGLREAVMNAVSGGMKNGIAVGIGLFIAFIGLKNGGLVVEAKGTMVALNKEILSPDVLLFLAALLFTGVLYARGVRGAILYGIAAATLLAVVMKWGLAWLPAVADSSAVTQSKLHQSFELPAGVFSAPPSLGPTFFQMDVLGALSLGMLPFVAMFFFMDMFDTMGTLIGVSEQAGLMKDGRLPRARQAMLADAAGTVAGACLGTSTVTSYVESAAGVEQGGRTGLTAITVAALFVAALFFSPVIAMVGSYPPLTAPALVIVGWMMIKNVTKIPWDDPSESLPPFLTIVGIPFTHSIADGIALGLVSYPIIKLASGRRVNATMCVLAALLVLYFVLVRRA